MPDGGDVVQATVTRAPSEARGVPAGTLTLVMTDVEGSTRMWADKPVAMDAAMSRHHEIVHTAVAEHGGWRPVDQGEGDAVFAAFDSAAAAVAAVAQLQTGLAAEVWPAGLDLRVRVGVHSGDVTSRDGNLFGPTVNRCARLRGLAAGGQSLLSRSTWELVRDRLPAGLATTELGEHRMKDLTRAEGVYQLDVAGLPREFGPLASLDRARHNLPVQTSSFLGRGADVAEIAALVRRERLVTIVGFGGMGKTRLALQVAAELADEPPDGVWFVDLSVATRADQVAVLIAAALGVTEGPAGILPALLTELASQDLLLVLDNVEHLLPDAADTVDQLLRHAPAVRILATSRAPLRLRGEHEYGISALGVPPSPGSGTLGEAELGSLSTFDAVVLFLARATAVRRDFALTPVNAAAVAAICVRLDGMPLALELAAARIRSLSPEALLHRLDHALAVLTGGSRDLPSRQQTLRATIAYSYDALPTSGQRLLDRLSVFPAPFSLAAAEAVCGPPIEAGEEEINVLDGIELLVERSLVRHEPATDEDSEDRYSLLVSIRDFAGERAERAGLAPVLAARHAHYYSELLALPAEWSLEDTAQPLRLVAQELSQVRAALATARCSGTSDEEVTLVRRAIGGLGELGMRAEARAALTSALRRPASVNLDYFLVRSFAVFDGDRWDEPTRARARDLVELAERMGDPSLIAYANLTLLETVSAVREATVLFTRITKLIDGLPPSGLAIPRWVVDHYFAVVRSVFTYLDAGASLAVARRRVHSVGPAWEREHARRILLEALILCGCFAEAEPLATAMEQVERDDLPGATDGLLWAAQFRLATGDWAAALIDAERARSHLPDPVDPSEVLWVALIEASAHRGAGRLDRARAQLVAILGDKDFQGERAEIARAQYLLSVICRQEGDAATAADLLATAWAAVAGWDARHLDVLLECLLERAVQINGRWPAEAARLLGAVRAHQGQFALMDGVTYDTDAMLTELRNRLGDAEVDRILADAAAADLPSDPDLFMTSP